MCVFFFGQERLFAGKRNFLKKECTSLQLALGLTVVHKNIAYVKHDFANCCRVQRNTLSPEQLLLGGRFP